MTLFLILLVLSLTAIASGFVLWKSNIRAGASAEMGCGDCGYPVRGLEAWQCPECGVDLRDAGIWPKHTSGARFVGVLLVCSGSSLLVGLLLVIGLYMQDSRPYTPPRTVTPPPNNAPNTNPF